MTNNIYVVDTFDVEKKDMIAAEYMLAHKGERFFYVAPYLNKAERIYKKCGKALDMTMRYRGMINDDELDMKETDFYGQYIELIEDDVKHKRNVIVPHYILKHSTPRLTEWLREHRYTLIVDNVPDLLLNADSDKCDLEILVDAGVFEETDGRFKFVDKNKIYKPSYKGSLAQLISKAREDAYVKTKHGYKLWSVTPEIIGAAKNIIAFEDGAYNWAFDNLCKYSGVKFTECAAKDINM